ncbi:MAG: helix-turn-helix transcriptional regulator [Alphaproteobacteria bacterium]|nr:helix-turn-helix transcriptional regulator [Alphaproteobacteria bacterium]
MESLRSACPIASTLDVLGDRWSLIIVRDLLTGKRLFSEFLGSPEGISTNILANRLKRMEVAGLVAKRPYQRHPTRYAYELTARGNDLLPVLQEICIWANGVWPNTWKPPASFMAGARTS